MDDEMRDLCTTLEQLTGALLTAVQASDVITFDRLARGRDPYVAAFVARWPTLSEAEQAELEPSILLVLSLDSTIIAAGQDWMRTTRQRLRQMQQGKTTMKGYRAPFTALHDSIRQRH